MTNPARLTLPLAEAALESAGNAVLITDAEARIEYCNSAFTRMTGYSLDEVRGRKTSMLKSGRQERAFYENLWATLSAGCVWHGRFTNRRKDGSLYEEESTIAPIRDELGRTTHFVAIKNDITAQVRLEKVTLRNERLGLIGQLASSIAHDLNNLLTPLHIAVPVLKEQPLDPFAKEVVDALEASAERTSGLVQQLLDFIRGGRSVRTAIEAGDFLRRHLRALKLGLPDTVALSVECLGEARLVADVNQLFEALQNLVVNASDAGARSIRIVARTLGDAVQFVVTDDGGGIPEDVLPKIFEPFFTTKPVGRGTGLGLATVKRVLEAHGGRVAVQSHLGRGTEFELWFPGEGAKAAA